MKEIGAVVEGYYAAESIHQLAQREGVDMPICRSIFTVQAGDSAGLERAQ